MSISPPFASSPTAVTLEPGDPAQGFSCATPKEDFYKILNWALLCLSEGAVNNAPAILTHIAGNTYAQDALVLVDNVLYQANTSTTDTPPSTDWDVVTDFSASTTLPSATETVEGKMRFATDAEAAAEAVVDAAMRPYQVGDLIDSKLSIASITGAGLYREAAHPSGSVAPEATATIYTYTLPNVTLDGLDYLICNLEIPSTTNLGNGTFTRTVTWGSDTATSIDGNRVLKPSGAGTNDLVFSVSITGPTMPAPVSSWGAGPSIVMAQKFKDGL